ncbi:MAG: CoA transferase [Crocinitomicaceae bacterium]|nr:CoA transferase [Crocinitomicaceae bacterium]
MIPDTLKNLKVIELAGVLAGPSVGMFFAECGAHVLKIENKKTGGDVTRSWKLSNESKDSNISAYFSSVNYKKNYLMIDLSDQKELTQIKNEIASADIVIVNFKKGDDTRYGLDYETLKKSNPTLIYGSITGFGESSDRVAYDLILQAESGFMAMNGTPDSGPVKMPVALIDLLAGHQLKEGLLLALLQRQQNGKGTKVSVSLYESAIASLANQASNWLMAKHNPQPIGSLHPNIAPYGEIFTTSDNQLITFAIGTHKQFENLCEFLDLKNLVTDKQFCDNQQRVLHRQKLFSILKDKINQRSTDTIMDYAHAHFIPAAIIKSVQEVFESAEAKNLVREEMINGELTRRVSGTVFHFSN